MKQRQKAWRRQPIGNKVSGSSSFTLIFWTTCSLVTARHDSESLEVTLALSGVLLTVGPRALYDLLSLCLLLVQTEKHLHAAKCRGRNRANLFICLSIYTNQSRTDLPGFAGSVSSEWTEPGFSHRRPEGLRSPGSRPQRWDAPTEASQWSPSALPLSQTPRARGGLTNAPRPGPSLPPDGGGAQNITTLKQWHLHLPWMVRLKKQCSNTVGLLVWRLFTW